MGEAKSNVFAKASFVSDESNNALDLNDPNFWANLIPDASCGPQHGLSSNTMALITSDCGAMRLHAHQMALIASGCVRQEQRRDAHVGALSAGRDSELLGHRAHPRAAAGEESRPAAAIPMENPYCSCRLTSKRRCSRSSSPWSKHGESRPTQQLRTCPSTRRP